MFRYINFTPTAPARRARSFENWRQTKMPHIRSALEKALDTGLIKPLASNHDVLKPGEHP